MQIKHAIPFVFLAAALAAVWLYFSPFRHSDGARASAPQAKIVSPRMQAGGADAGKDSDRAEKLAFEDVSNAKIALAEGESAISVITQDFDGDPQDEQIIAIRKAAEPDGPIYLAYADFDDTVGGYKRVWDAATGTTRTRTFSVFVKDLIGDRSLCVVASGMNGAGEQTMTVFRKQIDRSGFDKIADLRTDGSISVSEKDRSQAYHMGMASGASYKISIYGRDFESANILDQIETVYDFDPATNRYERVGVARIPGAQIEQRRVRQLLDGTPDKFERFLDGLWAFSSASGELSTRQYVLFDPGRREVIFYSDDTQEVFTWENSNATRYGLYLTTKNISVTTLRRLIDIELESADSIRLKAFEDIRLKIGVVGRWDGTYRKVSSNKAPEQAEAKRPARIKAEYEGSDGLLRFQADGRYDFGNENGVYAFFMLEGREYLELRKGKSDAGSASRAVYSVERSSNSIALTKVRLGAHGAEDLHERQLSFKAVPSK